MTTTATRPAPSTRRHHVVGLASAFGIGMLVAVQSRLNGELGGILGDGVSAALISFGSGLLILLVASAVVPPVRHGVVKVWRTVRRPMRGYGGLRWWQCLGGLSGAFLVATQSITVSVIGVAVFLVAGVAGQAISSLVVDRLGFGPAGPQPLTAVRIVGALIALVAVALAVSEQLSHPDGLMLAILPALAGVGSAVQQAINGRVARAASSDAYGAVAAGLVNFLVGFVALLAVFAVDLALRGAPRHLPSEPWLYLGGACGVIFISAAAAVVRVVGVFVLGLGTIAGQLIASLFIDVFLPVADKPVTTPVVAGTLLALVAVAVAAVPNLRYR
ncbi:DMT family transporter [Kribbella speibonae]|uniref:DMT family transporter n=1 Tax=Kribbella speibonae TaxID=1572660 RepID=A0A4R0IDN9_9ACTN|nr:DMT family transporter [Kribbella speibonae]TCC23068.1 DMT family transporter [Kribbella speibonae]TCC30064.1 DMT family transporter [Kribbella speibonae]